MPYLSLPDNFRGSEPRYHFVLINSPPPLAGFEYEMFRVPADTVCVVRYLNVAAIGSGTVGTFTASLQGRYNFGDDAKVGYGGELFSTSPANFAAAHTPRITWSTDVDTAYDNTDDEWGRIAQVPIPVTYLPTETLISVVFYPSAGGNANPYVDFAQLVVELTVRPGVGADDLALESVYLLPVNQ